MQKGKTIFKHKKKAVTTSGQTAEIFGIAGSGPGVGVTHFSVQLANYLIGVRHKRTAVLEWNDSGDFERMQAACRKKSVSNTDSDTFILLEVFYVKRAGSKELSECINHGFDIVIIDFGSDFESVREEFLRCDRKVLLGSFSEWQVGAFIDLIVNKRKEEGRWELLAAFGSEEIAVQMNKAMHIFVRQIPKSMDAFTITGEIMAFFDEFLKY